MKAIILAAGRGSRLNNLTNHQPKCMVQLKNRPLLDYQVSALCACGITHIAVVRGYLKDKIHHPLITNFFDNPDWATSNMVHSLLQADDWLKQDTCIISYGDIFYQSSVIQKLLLSNHGLSITYDTNFKDLWNLRFSDPLNDLESFKIKDGYVVEIGKKVTDIKEIMGQYMGLLKITPSTWEQMKMVMNKLDPQPLDPWSDPKSLDMTTFLNAFIQWGGTIQAVPIDESFGQWGEVDHISDLKLYENL